eukprot:CAMPEP_0198490780 /NCGR_PEP_ID=MMETSP1462-20131121/2382_1 /TAXON_ID=1333877 /ORGANISM="Brandtodinium nutriculum, Strain RCC3387" /LENGTH=64 /DNA_ID=CAMNT_0044219361 /DNA_START=84 /DNA_END=275 /DNA_ORIENTATION=+
MALRIVVALLSARAAFGSPPASSANEDNPGSEGTCAGEADAGCMLQVSGASRPSRHYPVDPPPT